MTHAPSPPVAAGDLASLAARLSTLLVGVTDSQAAHMQELSELIHEGETYLHRRAARSERDRACYRIGGALEPNGGHLLDEVALSGADHLGAFTLLLLVPIAVDNPGESLSGLLRHLFETETGAQVREWGLWSRGVWLRNLYIEETETFLQSKRGQEPRARWRAEKVTARQKHLLREISRALEVPEPSFASRGEAFEWIKRNGGNPRFKDAPAMPALPSFGREAI